MGADIGEDIFTFTLKLFIYTRNSGETVWWNPPYSVTFSDLIKKRT